MKYNEQFWKDMELLIQNSSITIDRPRHSAHPRYPELIYPLDYGYLENTTSSDGGGIDIWLGSTANTKIKTFIIKIIINPCKWAFSGLFARYRILHWS